MAVNWSLAGPGYDALQTLGVAAQTQQLAMEREKQQFTLDQHQRQLQTRQQAASALGNNDYQGATQAALQGGDIDLVKQISGLHDDHQKKLAGEAETLAKVSAGLRQLPQEQRAAALQQYSPMLMQQGFTPQEIQQGAGDLSDGHLDANINLARSITDTLSSGRVKYMAVPQGGYLQGFDSATGQPIGGGGQPAPQQGGGPQPGTVVGGFQFQGGNPNDRSSWKQVGGASPQGGATFP